MRSIKLSAQANAGFTLIEVLVAALVLAGGLLGLAALQATSLANNQGAYNKSQATQMAYDIADRIRANTLEAANYDSDTLAPEAATCPNNPNQNIVKCTACTSAANPCTAAQIRQKDLWEWNNLLKTLPFGQGRIDVTAGVYEITISWDDTKSGAANNSFVTKFQL